MKTNYKISDIKEVLEIWGQNHPNSQTISFAELVKATKIYNKPLIYNVEDIIRLLSEYIANNYNQPSLGHSESEVCTILKVRKLSLHQWRAKGYIRYNQLATRTISYNLNFLLEDLKNVRDKNISKSTDKAKRDKL